MSNDNERASGGIGFMGLLQLAFIVLKLMGYIEWSWWWVLAPTWSGLALWLLGFVVFAISVYRGRGE